MKHILKGLGFLAIALSLTGCPADSASASAAPAVTGNGITINHTNFDPSSMTDAEITAAAALDVYFEDASTGTDIVGNSDTNSSAGKNYSGSTNCGLAQLYALNNRYLCARDHWEPGNDYTWFATHGGLQTNRRDNPNPATLKLSGFLELSADMRAALDVAMFKFCWIDAWSDSGINDGAAFAATMIADITAFEAANPGLTVPYWTMPLQSNEAYEVRDTFNAAIRTHCTANNKWLLDMADLENYNDSNVQAANIGGYNAAVSSYVIADGGHLSADGRLRMAKAYWKLIAEIAKTK